MSTIAGVAQDPLAAAGPAGGELTDKRRARGARTRGTVLRTAVDVASADGLEGVTFGRLAALTGLSKAGVQALFRTKEALQLATVDLAAELFRTAVVRPAADAAPGAPRLRALLENWIRYAEGPLFAGGCFWSATLAEQDSRPGPVRDALLRQHEAWIALLAEQLRAAAANGEARDLDADLAAFEVDAVLAAVNVALRLGDTGAAGKARLVVESLLR